MEISALRYRLILLFIFLWFLKSITLPMQSLAQSNIEYPTKPIRLLTATAVGGGVDATSRAIANKLTVAWGQQVVVDNRAGASGAIAYEHMSKATPDGYTLMIITATHTINSLAMPNWPYDITRMMAPLSQLTSLFYVIYHHPSVPVSSFKELLAYARANPGKLHYGTGGRASVSHLGWEIIAHMAGVKLAHVPYKGAAPAISATVAGEMQIGFATLISLRSHIVSGRARPVAITAKHRAPTLPDIPTVAESGLPGYEVDQWYGVVTNAKVPTAIVQKLSAGIIDAIKSPDVIQRLAADGSTAVGSSPLQFSAHIKSEILKWGKVLEDTGLKLSGSKI